MLRSIFFNTVQKNEPPSGPTRNRVGHPVFFYSLCPFAAALLPTVAELATSAPSSPIARVAICSHAGSRKCRRVLLERTIYRLRSAISAAFVSLSECSFQKMGHEPSILCETVQAGHFCQNTLALRALLKATDHMRVVSFAPTRTQSTKLEITLCDHKAGRLGFSG